MEHKPRRASRKPVKQARPARPVKADIAPDAELAASKEATQEQPVRRRRKADVTGGLKLYAPPRPGFTRRFFNDKGNRLAEAQDLGYSFVEEQGIATHGPGTRVNRLAGTQDSGAPLKTFLMETPDELWQQGSDEKEEERTKVDLAINQGLDPSGETDPRHSYRPGEVRHSSITVDRG